MLVQADGVEELKSSRVYIAALIPFVASHMLPHIYTCSSLAIPSASHYYFQLRECCIDPFPSQ